MEELLLSAIECT